MADFELTDDNAEDVIEICRRVDGLPLAIELVAAHARLLSPKSILARLRNPLRLLTGGPQDAPDRHKTMRDAIEWSYKLLDEDEQRLFRRLSVFVGGFGIRVAEAVCNQAGDVSIESDDPYAIEVLEGIEALVDKSLVRRLEQSEAWEGDRRLGMLETVREYAYEQLVTSGESLAMQRRHADYYLALAQQMEADKPTLTTKMWLDRLNLEYDNLRMALRWLLEQQETNEFDDTLRLLLPISAFWERHSRAIEYQKWLEAGLGQAGPRITPHRIIALKMVGLMAMKQGDYSQAGIWASMALEEARKLGDKKLIASCLNTLGGVACLQGDYDASRSLREEALAINRELGSNVNIGGILINLGEDARSEGDYKRAEDLYRESLDLFRGLGTGHETGVMYSLGNLGHASLQLGNFQEARAAYLEALALAHETDSWFAMATVLVGLSGVILAEVDNPQHDRFQDLQSVKQVVRQLGLSAGLLERSGRRLEPLDQTEYEHTVAIARERLGKKAFTAAWEEGRAMTLDDALQFASQDEGARPRTRGRPRSRIVAGLTPREYEVAGLVMQGLSNEEIRRTLALSERTVEMHVSNTLRKLGLTTRTQLAAWAVEQGLRAPGHTQS